MTDIEKEMRIKELKSTIDVLRYECYVFNPLNLDRTALINKALDVAIRELKKVIVASEQESCEDCISRQTVLRELNKYLSGVPFEKGIDEVIKELPSIKPKEPQTDVLNKITEEIKQLIPKPTAEDVIDGNPIKDAVWETLIEVDKIIDKYRE